ncbi:MAG: integrase family protein [Ilumatobacteraceae bacterium]|nr:integrase family protein [Ilumatobacteraceae bacterium]
MSERASSRASAARSRSALEGWLKTQPSMNTRAAYRSDLETFGRWCAEHDALPLTADASTLVAFQLAREVVGDSDSTIRRRWSALSSFYEFAVEHELAASNPTIGADRPRVRSGDPSPTLRLSPAAVAAYRSTAAALDPRLHALVALLVSDGLKIGEALALDIDDVAGRSPTTSITVRRRGESRRIVIDRDSAKAIRRCIGQRRSGPVFVSERAGTSHAPQRLTRFGADHLIRQLRTDEMTEPVTANALRRFHFSTRQADGADHAEVRDGAGLADVRGVRRYSNRSDDDAARTSRTHAH